VPRRAVVSALAGVLLAISSASRAVAGPPFVTDDPVPTDYRNWEIYSGVQYQNFGGGVLSLGAPFLELNYGAMPNVQVSLATSLGESGAASMRQYGDIGTEFGVKTRFVQESNGWPQVSFYPSVTLPDAPGAHAVAFLPLWLQKSSGPWTAFGGGGLYLNAGPGQRDYTLYGMAVERILSPHLTLGAELYHQGASTIGGTDTTAANVGLIQQIGTYHAILFAAGRGFHGPDTFQAYASYEFALGPAPAH